MTLEILRATRKALKARIAFTGVSGSGKTYSALSIAFGLGDDVGVIDTEHRSASLYADLFEFSVIELEPPFTPKRYREAIEAMALAKMDVIIVDSLSHAWAGTGGALQMVDAATKRFGGNKWAAWSEVTPEQNKMIDCVIRCPAHVIVTMRSKSAWEITKDDKGKNKPTKIGLAPIQRDGIEYEFHIVGELDLDHVLYITKTRYPDFDGAVVEKPGYKLGKQLLRCLGQGEPDPVAGLVQAKNKVIVHAIAQGVTKEGSDQVDTTLLREILAKADLAPEDCLEQFDKSIAAIDEWHKETGAE